MAYKKTISYFEKNYDEKRTVRAKELKNIFKGKLDTHKNSIIYEVFIKKFSPINLGLTVINPGSIGKEFLMTRGHMHSNKTPEFYSLLDGEGILLLQKEKTKIIKLKKGKIFLMPGNYVHRLINTGNKKLKVLCIYDENAKPNYNIKFKKRVFRV